MEEKHIAISMSAFLPARTYYWLCSQTHQVEKTAQTTDQFKYIYSG